MSPDHDEQQDRFDGSGWVLPDLDGEGPVVMPSDWSPFPTSDEIAVIDAVRVLDLAEDAGYADPVELLDAVCSRQVDASDLSVLAGIDPVGLPSKELQLVYAQRVDAVIAFATSRQVLATAALAGAESTEDYLDEVHKETEVSLARRISPAMAGLEIETARALRSTFPDFLEALSAGRVSAGHCRKLVELTRPVADPAALAVIGAKALPKAQRLTVGLFARQVGKLISEHDPDAAARMMQRVRTDRDVFLRRLPDGMGQVVPPPTPTRGRRRCSSGSPATAAPPAPPAAPAPTRR